MTNSKTVDKDCGKQWTATAIKRRNTRCTLGGIKTHRNTFVHNLSKCWPILTETGVQCLGQISHTLRLNVLIYLQGHFVVLASNLNADMHIVPFQLVKNSYFKILQGSVATLFGWSWIILLYVVANLSKTLHTNFCQNRWSTVEVMTEK